MILGMSGLGSHLVSFTNYKRHTFVKMDIAQSYSTQLYKQCPLDFMQCTIYTSIHFFFLSKRWWFSSIF